MTFAMTPSINCRLASCERRLAVTSRLSVFVIRVGGLLAVLRSKWDAMTTLWSPFPPLLCLCALRTLQSQISKCAGKLTARKVLHALDSPVLARERLTGTYFLNLNVHQTVKIHSKNRR